MLHLFALQFSIPPIPNWTYALSTAIHSASMAMLGIITMTPLPRKLNMSGISGRPRNSTVSTKLTLMEERRNNLFFINFYLIKISVHLNRGHGEMQTNVGYIRHNSQLQVRARVLKWVYSNYANLKTIKGTMNLRLISQPW